jgi:hypothetical protein
MFDDRQAKAQIIEGGMKLHALYVETYAEKERLRKGIQDYLDGDYEPKVGKNDKCPHGQYGYETCEACVDEHFTRLLAIGNEQLPHAKEG